MDDLLKHCLARLIAMAGATVVLLALATPRAQAQITTIHNFTGPTTDGSIPFAGLTYDSSTGNYYGTTAYGGADDDGSIFKMDSSGNVIILHDFAGGTDDGANPQTGLVLYDGYLYGTTYEGGSYDGGIVFRVKTYNSGYGVLYSFQGNAVPTPSPVIVDSSGNLFGTTQNGGSCIDRPGSGCGVVFKLSPPADEVSTWSFTELYTFKGRDIANQTYDGESPSGGMIMDSAGNLYGTADYGGAHDDGIVFELKCTAPSTGNSCDTYATSDTVLYTFGAEADDADGGAPLAGLIMDSAGNLYGTTVRGGGSSNCGLDGNEEPIGCGTVFKLSPPTTGDTWTETVLHSFSGLTNDGMMPFAGLVRDSSGNLYGTTTTGGSGECTIMGVAGCGIAFKLDLSGNETVYSFTGPPEGGPYITASLVLGANGGVYGTTALGGSGSCTGFFGEDYGCGTVFALGTTPQAEIQAIIDQVSALSLKKGQTRALLDPLQTALKLLNKGKVPGAIDSLENFIGTVRGLYNAGKLTQAQYTELVNAANSVIEQLQAG